MSPDAHTDTHVPSMGKDTVPSFRGHVAEGGRNKESSASGSTTVNSGVSSEAGLPVTALTARTIVDPNGVSDTQSWLI